MATPSGTPTYLSARRRPPVWMADLALLAVTLIWGVTFPVVKDALGDASPLFFNAVRLSAAALLLAAVYRPSWRQLPAAAWRGGALLGFCLATGYAFQTAGLALTTASQSAFITGLSVILVPLLLAALWRRQLAPPAWYGAVLALLGLYLLVAAPGTGSSAAAPASYAGDWLTLVCALGFAFHIVCLGELAPRFSFRDLAILQIGFGAVFTWMAVPVLETPHWHNSPGVWAAVGLTAVLATAVAFTTQTWAQQFTPATHTAVVFAFEPVFAWLASAWGWHERLYGVQLAGAGLIVAAMLVVEAGKVGGG